MKARAARRAAAALWTAAALAGCGLETIEAPQEPATQPQAANDGAVDTATAEQGSAAGVEQQPRGPGAQAAEGWPPWQARSGAEFGAAALEAAEALEVAGEHWEGYDRDAFGYGPGENEDAAGCWARPRVLAAQAVTAPEVRSGCWIVAGEWISPYDGRTHRRDDGLEIDHLVALAEAWQSGAHAWGAEQLRAFGNSVEPWAMVAVTAELNQAKGAAGPEEWMPPEEAARCWYVWAWVETKTRWGLAMDPLEAEFVLAEARSCAAG